MACHRFLHLNAMTGQELYKLMTSRVGKQRSISGKNFERYIWKSKEFIGPFSEHAQARSINNILGLWLMTYSLECFHLDIVLNV